MRDYQDSSLKNTAHMPRPLRRSPARRTCPTQKGSAAGEVYSRSALGGSLGGVRVFQCDRMFVWVSRYESGITVSAWRSNGIVFAHGLTFESSMVTVNSRCPMSIRLVQCVQ